MRKLEDRAERIHQRIWELLPWYVNRSLGEKEVERVEAHLAVCPRCQEEERLCRQTAGAVRSAGESAPSPHPVQLQRVLERVEESEREERGRSRWTATLQARLAASPRPVRFALVAQAAAILLLVGWLAARPGTSPPPAVYSTLSDPAAAPAPGVGLRVMFSPQSTERELRALLLAVRGQVTGGPSPVGVYTIEIPADGDPAAVVLARLRSEPQVAFAEPAVDGDPGKRHDAR